MLVIHDIRGMADITRAVGDQLAQDGFIAIVPDFLSGKGPDGGGTASLGGVGQAIQALAPADVKARGSFDAAMESRQKVAGVEWQDWRRGVLLGRSAKLFLRRQPAGLNAAVVHNARSV